MATAAATRVRAPNPAKLLAAVERRFTRLSNAHRDMGVQCGELQKEITALRESITRSEGGAGTGTDNGAANP